MGKTWSKHFVFCITTYVYLYLDVKMPVYFERVVFSTPKRMITGKIPSIYIDVKKLQLFLFIEKIHKVCLATVSVLALYISFFLSFHCDSIFWSWYCYDRRRQGRDLYHSVTSPECSTFWLAVWFWPCCLVLSKWR